jgi:hypothetical protein
LFQPPLLQMHLHHHPRRNNQVLDIHLLHLVRLNRYFHFRLHHQFHFHHHRHQHEQLVTREQMRNQDFHLVHPYKKYFLRHHLHQL